MPSAPARRRTNSSPCTRLSTGYAPDFRLVAVIGYAIPISDTDPNAPNKRFKFAEHGADRDHDQIPDDIDLAVICLPGERVIAAADEALRKGVKALCVISAGFAEVVGRHLQAMAEALSRSNGQSPA